MKLTPAGRWSEILKLWVKDWRTHTEIERRTNQHVTYLQVDENLAHQVAQEPRFKNRLGETWRQTKDNGEEIRHSKIGQEKIGDSPKVLVPPDSIAHEEVASHSGDEHKNIYDRYNPLQVCQLQVVVDVVEQILKYQSSLLFI